jgi:hypothetical protein
MKPGKLILTFAAVFIAGAVIGSLVTAHFVHPHFGMPPSANEITKHIMSDLRGKLNLSPAQSEKIELIIAHNVQELMGFHRELEVHVQMSLDAADKQVEELLDPSQKVAFERFRANRPHLPRSP